jgi:hypothetical protein
MANSGLIFFVAIQFFNVVVAPQTIFSEDESCSNRPFYLRWMKGVHDFSLPISGIGNLGYLSNRKSQE